VDEYLCLTVLSRSGETAAKFAARLSQFWTRMLRERPAEFEKVYAETTAFENEPGAVLSRKYLVAIEVADIFADEMIATGIGHLPVDHHETYSKYEATPPEWMQVEH
jgi:hypothetical protein